jgi:hypothetical protein
MDVGQKAILKSVKVHELMANMYNSTLGKRLSDHDYADFNKKIADLEVMELNLF